MGHELAINLLRHELRRAWSPLEQLDPGTAEQVLNVSR